MLVPRALLTAATASAAALAFAGCGSDPSSDASAGAGAATTPVAADSATATPEAAAAATTPTSCPLKGADAVQKLIGGSKAASLTPSGCIFADASNPKYTVQLTFAAKADLTVAPGEKYPVIYAVYEKNYKKEPAAHYKALSGLGTVGYNISQVKPYPTTTVSWIQDGNYWSIKQQYFKASDSVRKKQAAATVAAARAVSAAN